nr:competence type IV pilus minor pilin ComGD [Neobacillus sp. Marseille-Q6967]
MIESLVVLSIFIVLSSITLFSIKPQANMAGDEVFISQLKADLYYAQQFAISHQHEVKVNFIPEQNRYVVYERNDLPNIIDRKYPSSIEVLPGTLPLSFRFIANGNINTFGTFLIVTKTKTYKMTFLIGKGRFYVTEG